MHWLIGCAYLVGLVAVCRGVRRAWPRGRRLSPVEARGPKLCPECHDLGITVHLDRFAFCRCPEGTKLAGMRLVAHRERSRMIRVVAATPEEAWALLTRREVAP